jgi:hypothetical protein
MTRRQKDARERFAKTGEYLSTQIFTNTPDIEGFMLGAVEYFFDKTRGISVRNWKNEVSWGSWDEWAHVYDPISQAPKIGIPVLVFSTDGALIPEQAKKFYDRVKSEKQLVWGTGYHFNFYDVFPEMMQAVDAVVPFMRKHLAPQTVSRASRNRARTVVAAIKQLEPSEISEPEGHPVTGRKHCAGGRLCNVKAPSTQLGLFRELVKSQFSPISPNPQAASRPSSSVFSISC